MRGETAAATRNEHDWLEVIRASILRGDLSGARGLIVRARHEHPHSIELRRCEAGFFQQTGQLAQAEALLRGLLSDHPCDIAAAFALMRLLSEQGRLAAAGATMRAWFTDGDNPHDSDLVISAIESLDDCGRKADAAFIAETAIDSNPDDARLHAYAGMLQMQLGEFERARQHCLYALERDERAWEWHMPAGISSAQRYADREHPDFALLRSGLERQALSDRARAELHFALGKAYDDVGSYADAVPHLRQGNQIIRDQAPWSRKGWRRAVEARLAATPPRPRTNTVAEFRPVFIVGMPRSGTTLLAELLSRYPGVRNRGELAWVENVAGQACSGDPEALERAAATYVAQTRQDDADGATWFIDKQPLNFRYVDVMLAMFPDAKVIHCTRGARDTALSLWMQCFTGDTQGYAYDFGDIAWVMRDEARLMAHWRSRYPQAVRDVRYENLVANPQTALGDLSAWIGLSSQGAVADGSIRPASAISTASLWQARQPVHSRSVGRWKHYAPQLPELLRFTG